MDLLPVVLLIIIWLLTMWWMPGLPKVPWLGLHQRIPPLAERVYHLR